MASVNNAEPEAKSNEGQALRGPVLNTVTLSSLTTTRHAYGALRRRSGRSITRAANESGASSQAANSLQALSFLMIGVCWIIASQFAVAEAGRFGPEPE